MIYQEALLKAKSKNELRQMMVAAGAEYRLTEKKSDLIQRLIELSLTAQPTDRLEPEKVEDKPKPEVPWLTKEEVNDAVMSYKLQGLKVSFSPDSKCWMFQFDCGMSFDPTTKLYGPRVLTDSGTMKQPIEVVKRCAHMLVRPTTVNAEAEQKRLREQAAVGTWA